MLNHITIIGRLVRDPELRYTQSGVPVASFTVAVDRDYAGRDGDRPTDFIDCVAWRQGGEFVSRYFAKGGMIVVSGRLESRKWQDRDGNNRVSWEINVEHSYFGESRRDSDNGSRRDWRPASEGGVNVYPEQEFKELDGDDGDNPFVNRQRAFEQENGKQTDLFDGKLPF